MEYLVALITGIAWPVAVVWIAHLLRTEIRTLTYRMSHLKYKDVEAKFETTLAEAEDKATAIERIAPSGSLPGPEVSSKLDVLRRVAELSPRAAIYGAWVLVEDAAAASGYIQGAKIPRVNPHLFVEELVRQGKLPAGSDDLVAKMRELRDQAAHIFEFSLSHEEADRYLQLAAKMSTLILNVV